MAKRTILLDPNRGVALFQQIAVILRDRIHSGRIAVGERLPSEADICADFGVSRITAKRALDELAREGLAERARGRGTIVTGGARLAAKHTSLNGWLENVSLMGEATQVRVLEFGYRPAPPQVAEALGLAAGEEAQHSIRVRSLDGRPLSHLETWVPADIGRGYDVAEMGETPLLKLLERQGVEVSSARQTITATVAPPNVAVALGIHAGAPLLDVRRLVMDATGRPIEHIRVLYRPELYRYEMDLTRVREADGARWRAEKPSHAPEGLAPAQDEARGRARAAPMQDRAE